MKKRSFFGGLLLAAFVATGVVTAPASPVIRSAAGANPAAIQGAADQFRADLGGVNNGAGNSFRTGRREINWDGVKDGRTDLAVWRPSNGNFFVARSSANFATFYGYGFGTNGDIPVQGAAQQ